MDCYVQSKNSACTAGFGICRVFYPPSSSECMGCMLTVHAIGSPTLRPCRLSFFSYQLSIEVLWPQRKTSMNGLLTSVVKYPVTMQVRPNLFTCMQATVVCLQSNFYQKFWLRNLQNSRERYTVRSIRQCRNFSFPL
jgi:hypothetical protein